jgi:hypothetical protein
VTLCASRLSGRRPFTGCPPQCPAEKLGNSSSVAIECWGKSWHTSRSSIGPVQKHAVHASQTLTHTATNIIMTSRAQRGGRGEGARTPARPEGGVPLHCAIDTFYSDLHAGSLGPQSFGLGRARRHPPSRMPPAIVRRGSSSRQFSLDSSCRPICDPGSSLPPSPESRILYPPFWILYVSYPLHELIHWSTSVVCTVIG